MISLETNPLVDCMIYSTMELNNVCRLSDLYSVQIDVCDVESVLIGSDIYIYLRLGVNGKI